MPPHAPVSLEGLHSLLEKAFGEMTARQERLEAVNQSILQNQARQEHTQRVLSDHVARPLTPVPHPIREPKLPDVPLFDGKSEQFTEFMIGCEQRFRVQAHSYASDDAKVAYVYQRLTGSAKRWLTAILEVRRRNPRVPSIVDSYSVFLEEFTLKFNYQNSSRKALDKIKLIKMAHSLDDYIAEFELLRAQVGDLHNDRVEDFIQGLTRQARAWLDLKEIESEPGWIRNYEKVKHYLLLRFGAHDRQTALATLNQNPTEMVTPNYDPMDLSQVSIQNINVDAEIDAIELSINRVSNGRDTFKKWWTHMPKPKYAALMLALKVNGCCTFCRDFIEGNGHAYDSQCPMRERDNKVSKAYIISSFASPDSIYLDMHYQDNSFKALVDTGAAAPALIQASLAAQLNLPTRAIRPILLKSFEGQEVETVIAITDPLEVTVNGENFSIEFLISHKLNCIAPLSWDCHF